MSQQKRSSSCTDSDYEGDVKPAKKRAGTKPAEGSPRKKPEAWTPEQDAKLLEAAKKILKENLWAAVKEDSSMKKRGSTGVQVRMGVLLKRLEGGK